MINLSILEVKELSHSYGGNTPFINDAVNNVSFSVEQGEIIGIIGHTGSGKSTLVQHLNGLLKPNSGEILLNGKSIWENPKEIRKIRKEVGLVFQYPEYQLFEETVYKDIAFGPKNIGFSEEEISACVKETCEIIGIKDDYLDKSPFDLSGGEKRRVAIAGVLAMKPKVIVFDEPTAGLDPKGREDVINIIKNYRTASGATIFIISHSMEDIAAFADRVLVMNKGKKEMFDTVENIFSNEDRLAEIGLSIPIVTQVFKELRALNIDVPKNVFTVSQAVEALKKLKEGNGNA